MPPLGNGPEGWIGSYMKVDRSETAMPLRLYKDGFDVWLAVTRGQVGSREHKEYEFEEEGFWDWSFQDLAVYETKAFFDFIYNETHRPISYMGFSQGTTQMFFAIGLEYEYYAERTNKVAQISPCTIPVANAFKMYDKEFIESLKEHNQFVVAGPNWEDD